MRKARRTVSLPNPLREWVEVQADANGISVNAYVTALVLARKEQQQPAMIAAHERHEAALRGVESAIAEMFGQYTLRPDVSENQKRRLMDTFVRFSNTLDGKEAA
jgi:hypothetical protein